FSGLFLALNWVFLFESYKRISIAQATLLYYTAPILVLLFSFFILKERLANTQLFSILLAFVGLWLTLGKVNPAEIFTTGSGAAFGLAAAVCYAGVMLLNPTLKGFENDDLTFFQLFIAAAV